jgi:hypothetical protein
MKPLAGLGAAILATLSITPAITAAEPQGSVARKPDKRAVVCTRFKIIPTQQNQLMFREKF